jgi:hypothetical protein
MRKIVSILVVCLVVCGVLSIGAVYCLPENNDAETGESFETEADRLNAKYLVRHDEETATETEATPTDAATATDTEEEFDIYIFGAFNSKTGYMMGLSFVSTNNIMDPNGKVYKPSDPEFARAYEHYKPVLEGKEPYGHAFFDGEQWYPDTYIKSFTYSQDNPDGTVWSDKEIKLLINYGYTQEQVDDALARAHKFNNQEEDPDEPNDPGSDNDSTSFWDKIVAFFMMIVEFFQGLFN